MRFVKKQEKWGSPQWVGRRNGFKFSISQANHLSQWYVFAIHEKKGIRFNSAWGDISFSTREQAERWCEAFKSEDYNCLK